MLGYCISARLDAFALVQRRMALVRPALAAFPLFALPMVLGPHAGAEVKLPSLISDNMVLQREVAVPIWGAAAPVLSTTP